jgi:hypothetical protein
VKLRRAGRTETLQIEEVGPRLAVPVLRFHLQQVPVVHPFCDATPDAADKAFEAEAPRHPVFLLSAGPQSG